MIIYLVYNGSIMALREKKEKAIVMRRAGASYTEIKETLKVSKSSLSLWLRDLPLSKKRLDELRGKNPLRIERFRETMRHKRETRLQEVRVRAGKSIGRLSERDIFIGGLFLYWGEGTKTAVACTAVANTDPAVLKFFVKWLGALGVPRNRLRVKLHLYKDMNVAKELRFWSKELQIPLAQFRKTYIKDSKQSMLTHTQRFVHGTCNIMVDSRDLIETVLMSLEHVRSQFAEKEAM